MTETLSGRQNPDFQNEGIRNDIDDELNFHLQMAALEAREKGMSDVDADRWAVDQFGDIERIRIRCLRMAWKELVMEKLLGPAAIIVVLFLFAGVAVALFFTAQARHRMALESRHMAMQAEQEAMLARQEAEAAQQRTQATNQFLVDVLQSVDDRRESNDMTVIDILTKASRQISVDFADQPEVIEKLRQTLEKAKIEIEQNQTTKTAKQNQSEADTTSSIDGD